MISRALLRFATVQALRQQDYDVAPVTLAGDMVFDSRLDDIEFDEPSLELPIITVYTEADERVGQSQGPVPTGELRHIDLQIEIAIGSFQKTGEDAETPSKRYVLPTTDAELEFLLDCFEQQVMNALTHPFRKASLAWRKQVVNIDAWHSMPSRSADKNNRLAARTISLRCRVNPMCLQRVSTTPLEGQPSAVPTIPAAPYLDAMIERLAEDEQSAGLVAILREQLGQGPQVYVPPFKRFGGVIDPTGAGTALQAFIQSKLDAQPPPLTAVTGEQVQFQDQYDDPTSTSN